MKIKNFLVFSILFLFCVLGCGDEGLETVLYDLGAAPAALGVVTEVPPDIKEIIWGKDDVDTLLVRLKDTIANDGYIGGLIHLICLRGEREAYYEKYISAGGVAIMGNGHIDDRFFYAARDIVLGMTSKRPELRAVLTPSREKRPGATQFDTVHDVTGRATPSRMFRMILVHNDMSYTSVPEFHLGNGTIQFHVAPGLGSFWPNIAWVSVGGYRHLERISIYGVFCHEFAHAIHTAIRLLDPTFDARLETAYASAIENVSYFSKGYALSGPVEYWAHSVTEWFGNLADPRTGLHDVFLQRDPLMYDLLAEWFDLIDLRAVNSRVYE